jgi:hypothetical protein
VINCLKYLLPVLLCNFAVSQKPQPPEVMVCKYAWILYFDQDKDYNGVCCVSDGFTANTCTVYACAGETIYFSGQVDAPNCIAPYPYTAVWNFGALAPSVTDSNITFAFSSNVNDSMTPLHAVTIPPGAGPGSVYPVFFSYCYSCNSSAPFCDTTSILTINILPDSLFLCSVVPDSACTGQLVTVSYFSNVPGQNSLPGQDYDFGDSSIITSMSSHFYSDTGTYLVSVKQIGALCYHNQSDTVTIEDCVGITEERQNEFSIFPNPCSDILIIKTAEVPELVSVMDVLGNVVLVSQERKINISSLPAGIYYLCFENKNGMFSTRFVRI